MIEHAGAWTFTGLVVDCIGKEKECAVCGDPHLRFSYQVQTRGKKRTAYVGYDCLLKHPFNYDIPISEILENRSKLQSEASKRAVINRLIEIKNAPECAEDNFCERLIQSYKRYQRFSPKQAVFLIRKCRKYGMSFPYKLLNITSKEKQHREQIASLSKSDLNLLDSLLSDSQKRWNTQ